jgi:Tfp pilus assembly protein PilN
MIKINLIPAEYVEKLDKRAMVAKAILAGVLAVAVVFVVSGWYYNKARSLSARAVKLEAELKGLQGDVDKAKQIEAQITEVQKYLNAIDRINHGRLLYPYFMQDLLVNLPGTIWFGGVNTVSKGDTLSVTLPTFSKSTYDLAYWISALESDPKFADIGLGSVSVSEDAAGKTLTTSVTLKYTRK